MTTPHSILRIPVFLLAALLLFALGAKVVGCIVEQRRPPPGTWEECRDRAFLRSEGCFGPSYVCNTELRHDLRVCRQAFDLNCRPASAQ